MSPGHRYIFAEQIVPIEEDKREEKTTRKQQHRPCVRRLRSDSELSSSSMEEERLSHCKGAVISPRRMDRKRYKYYAAMTGWPYFVYEQFDADLLVEKIHKKLKTDLSSLASVSAIPRDPTDLSFWLAQNLTISDTLRLQMLKMDTPVERLRFASRLLDKVIRVIECNQCQCVIANHGDIFSMSIEGPQGTYVNPHGFVHELITVTKIKHTVYRGLPSTEASWFPGYSWRIVECRVCRNHLGWKFEAVERLKPAKFWGLAKRSVNFKYDFNVENDCPNLDAPPDPHRTRSESTSSDATEGGSRRVSFAPAVV
jgi:cereblon